MRKVFRRFLKTLLFTFAFVIAFAALYLLAAWGLSRITVERVPAPAEVEIYLLSNGVHSDIVVPAANEVRNWRLQVPTAHTLGNDTTAAYLAFGWGDKGFYLETPTFADLTAKVALKAVFGLSTSAMHTTYYRSMHVGADCKRILISKAQYAQLVKFIDNSFKDKNVAVIAGVHYNNDDAFYDGRGRYHLFHTCNTWTNNALKACGQRACLWTPFDKGSFTSIAICSNLFGMREDIHLVVIASLR
ncbi:TIGR02117 family protein [Chitinophaga horti]|uniref:TIGR02117 family protein n=1 Tax=Chitinophaga horti TaxID=2920382 RepID=A0ABY6J4P1_9BACT|nr:TIGR02117 family protein [Chitinophaga horti]UYQ93182.1 TIGR02117 family protein [Chitinophaga horti]